MARGTFDFRFDGDVPDAVHAARQHAASRVTQITGHTQRVIREVIAAGLRDHIVPREIAKLVKLSIGLSSRDASALLNFQKKLKASGLTKTVIETQTKRYADKLLQNRAMMIARTETIHALNAGQLSAWRHAQDRGLLSDQINREWITDSDPCPMCAALGGQIARGLFGLFSGGLLHPPAHPRCECSVGLVRSGRRAF